MSLAHSFSLVGEHYSLLSAFAMCVKIHINTPSWKLVVEPSTIYPLSFSQQGQLKHGTRLVECNVTYEMKGIVLEQHSASQ